MYVPNYVPEPLEVPANVTLDPYPVRLAFLRRVTALHATSLLLVAGAAWIPIPPVPFPFALLVLAGILLLFDLLRVRLRGQPLEARLSVVLAAPIVLATALCARMATLGGIPVWAILLGPAFALAYTLLCGRDYSFVGCGLLSLIGSSVLLAGAIVQTGMGHRQAAWALGLNTAYLLYFVYDLASLMSRRRRGEEMAAVVDLYRDVFNVFGYVPRVVSHWRRHRIWQDVVPLLGDRKG